MRIALTSARENSKRLPRKELLELGGKYVIDWTLEQMHLCDLFDIKILSTDWVELIDVCKDKYPDIIFLERPKELALDDTPAQDYITHALKPYSVMYNDTVLEFCLLQSTSPLRQMHLIYKTHSRFTGRYNSLFTVNRHTLYPDGQVYWFRDVDNIWKPESYPFMCDPMVQLDYPHDYSMAKYLIKNGGFD